MNPGMKLRELRESLGYTLKQVEFESRKIADLKQNEEYFISLSRIAELETKPIKPGMYRLHALSLIYNVDYIELLHWYGIIPEERSESYSLMSPTKTYLIGKRKINSADLAHIPIELDPGFDVSKTTNIGRMIMRWGYVPLQFLSDMALSKYTYGYIGSEDLTMYPLILPGSFIQVDESKNKVQEGIWKTEFERPIYFIEYREGFTCCWCTVDGSNITLQSHPLSPVKVKVMKYPQDAEIIGQVIGIAMRLDQKYDIGLNARSRTAINQNAE